MAAVLSRSAQHHQSAELLGPRDICRLLGVSAVTLRRMTREHTFPAPLRLSQRMLRWSRQVVDRWLADPTGGAAS
jgi:predicted DNA-binding transcriptional regulator AlpA